MTIPANIRVNTQAPFPSLIKGTGPVAITKQNGIWTVGIDTAALQTIISTLTGREQLTANRTYYVSTTGNDGNDGLSAATPFLTIQHAVDVILFTLDVFPFTATIQLEDGTYSEAVVVSSSALGATGLVIQGNVATPANVIWTSASGDNLQVFNGGSVTVLGITFTNTDVNAVACIIAGEFGSVTINTVVFGNNLNGWQLQAAVYGALGAAGNYTISGSAVAHAYATAFGIISLSGQTITITGAPNFSTAFAYGDFYGFITAENAVFVNAAFATGPRYLLDGNSALLQTSGSPTFLPGSLPGEVDNNSTVWPFSQVVHGLSLSNGNNNDIARIGGSNYIRITGPTGPFTITGFAASTSFDGIQIIVQNAVAQTMTIANLSGSSSAANQILTNTGGDVVLLGLAVATFIYSATDTKWILTGTFSA